jgi:hypothetical protein
MPVKLIRIDGPSPVELGRFKTQKEAVTVASLLVGLGGHWSSDRTTLVAPDGARYKIVTQGKDDMFKFKVNQHALNDRIAWAREARSMTLEALVKDIKHFHGIQWHTPCTEFLLEVERRLQISEDLEAHEGPSARAWAEALGIGRDHRHSDCEGLSEFNNGFQRSGSLWGVIKMLDCAGGGSPPTTEQFLDRERSGAWYPRSCR